MDHNQYQNSVKGMRIHVKFEVNNFKGAAGTVNAYFYQKDGDSLKDFNGQYKTKIGQVSVGEGFTPRYVNSTYEDFKLFMPYQELHIARGKHNLKFDIQIFDASAGKSLSSVSDPVYFNYSH